MTRYQAIIFDLDGTLLHSAPDLHAAANVALSRLGRSQLDLETVTSFIGNGVEKLIERCLLATGEDSAVIRSEALSAFMESYGANMTTLTRPYPGVVDCLERLKQSGTIMGICTNKPAGPAREICDQLNLSRFFAQITGAEAGKAKKPDPEPLLNTIALLNAGPADVLYVGDSNIDYETAMNANVAFRLFSGGYLKSPIAGLPAETVFDDWAHSGLLAR